MTCKLFSLINPFGLGILPLGIKEAFLSNNYYYDSVVDQAELSRVVVHDVNELIKT